MVFVYEARVMFRKQKKNPIEDLTVAHLKIDDEYDTILDSSNIKDASVKIKEKKIPDLVVVDRDNKVRGIVSTFDIVTKAVAADLPLATTVTQIMTTTTPFSLNTKIIDCFNIMKKDQVEVVPVADTSGKLIGVVTIMDVFNVMEYYSSK